MDREVFSVSEFVDYAKEKWILVELDFPHGKEARDPAQNERLQREFGVRGFPTIVFLDPTGKELGRMVGYGGMGPGKFIEELEGRRSRAGG